MKSASLLNRVRRPELAVARHRVPASELRADILAHLRGMCGTRLGGMSTRADYGLPDVTEMVHGFPEAIATMRRALKRTIETHEPRLTGVSVNYVPSDDLVVRFEILAEVVMEGGTEPIRFETAMEVTRKMTVK